MSESSAYVIAGAGLAGAKAAETLRGEGFGGPVVLIGDETCDSGATMRLAGGAIVNAGAAEVRTAVAFQTGSYEPDYHALATDSTIVLPWDREVLFQGELVPNPLYRETLGG